MQFHFLILELVKQLLGILYSGIPSYKSYLNPRICAGIRLAHISTHKHWHKEKPNISRLVFENSCNPKHLLVKLPSKDEQVETMWD